MRSVQPGRLLASSPVHRMQTRTGGTRGEA